MDCGRFDDGSSQSSSSFWLICCTEYFTSSGGCLGKNIIGARLLLLLLVVATIFHITLVAPVTVVFCLLLLLVFTSNRSNVLFQHFSRLNQKSRNTRRTKQVHYVRSHHTIARVVTTRISSGQQLKTGTPHTFLGTGPLDDCCGGLVGHHFHCSVKANLHPFWCSIEFDFSGYQNRERTVVSSGWRNTLYTGCRLE
jgi:hypothetical protein